MADPVSSTTQTKSLPLENFRVSINNPIGFLSGGAEFSGKLGVDDMSSMAEKLAVLVKGPSQGNCYRIAVTTSNVVYNLPSGMDGNTMISLKAVGGDLQYQFGVTGQTLSLTLDDTNSTSGGGPLDLAANNAVGPTLSDGETVHKRINAETQLAVIAAAACNLEIWISSHPYTVS